jgi:hypothetical protein
MIEIKNSNLFSSLFVFLHVNCEPLSINIYININFIFLKIWSINIDSINLINRYLSERQIFFHFIVSTIHHFLNMFSKKYQKVRLSLSSLAIIDKLNFFILFFVYLRKLNTPPHLCCLLIDKLRLHQFYAL